MGAGLGGRIARGRLFAQLKDRAIEYLKNPERLRDLLRRAAGKADAAGGRDAIREMWDTLQAFLRLLRAYVRGEYRQVPLQSLVLIVAGVLYFVTPIDVIPDFIVGLGFLDDIAVLSWVLHAVRTVNDDFLRWEAARAAVDRGTPTNVDREG